MYKIKATNEWFIDAPWGKIALISWGEPSGTPILLVHGRQDSAVTFIPLLEHLPDTYYYVGVDLPGHGRSDPLPIGPMLTRFHFLVAIEYALRHLKWDQFVFIGHSMGCEQGLFYNRIYPGKITKFIFLDPLPSLQRLQIHNYEEYYRTFYKEYYSKYKRYNYDDRVYSKKKVLETVMRNRGLSEKEAELVLSRNLHFIGEDLYKLSWDKRLKFPAPQNYPVQYYTDLFSKLLPPTLIISASNSLNPDLSERNEKALHIISELQKKSEYFFVENVSGGHDIHLTDSESVASCVLGFLCKTMKKAKL